MVVLDLALPDAVGPSVYQRIRDATSQEAVVVRSGPLKDLYGIFERYVDEGGRVRILLSLVGYSAAVELESEQIAKV